MKLQTAAPLLAFSLLVLAGCASDATKAREALVQGKQLTSQAPEQAAVQFSSAARLDPRLHEAFARLARVRLTQGRAHDAETAALRAASLVPRSSYYSELLGRTQLAGRQTDAAIASLEQAITLDAAQTGRLAFTVGALREQQGKSVEAQTAYERAATADASALLPRLALARLHLGADRLDDAKRRLDEVRLRVPAAGDDHVLFARLDARVTALIAERQAKLAAERLAALGNEGLDARAQAASAGILRMLLGDSDSGRLSDVLGSLHGDTIGDSFGFGGLGLSGIGTGGGGTGQGTIGLGNIGTIGHSGGGSGIGYGSGAMGGMGGMGRRTTPAAMVTAGSATIAGPLSAEVIARIVRAHMGQLRYCYESALARNPTLSGRASLSFVIGANGGVTTSSATGIGDATAEACFASSVRRWAFPAPDGGGVVRVTYPINLAPAPAAPAPAP